MRQAMLQTQKLESVGTLAGGLAHDFDDLLTAILGQAASARDGLGPGSARDALEDLVRCAQRASHLAKQLLAYSGRSPAKVQSVDLSHRVRDVSRLVQASIPGRVRWMLEVAGDVPSIRADAAQISQVVMNLLMNAGEAIGARGGVVRVATGVCEISAAEAGRLVASREFGPGRHVFLCVEDDGCGLDREALSRIFDPFYTTKGAGRGMGLAAVLGIVRSHAGALSVTSEPGRGSSFKVFFPVSERTSSIPPQPPAAEGLPAPARRRTVLVVDDQSVVRSFAERVLRAQGYEVALAPSGEEGVARYRARPEEIDVVLLDVAMPGMSGLEAFNEVIKVKADVPVILMSGGDERDAARGLEDRGLALWLAKPFTPAELGAKLQEALRKR